MESAVVYPRRFASLVKLEHTVFALPFAYVGAFLALDEVPSATQMVWLTLAMVGARSLAMAINRLVDAGIDARNPRTAGRELPQGTLRPWQVLGLLCRLTGVFLLAVFNLDPVVRWLWPIPVAMFVVYPYLKRVTWLSHAWLGATLGLAPVGGWVAMTGELPLAAWLLGAAVACLGGRLRPPLRDLRHRDRPRAEPPLVSGALRRPTPRSGARACCTSRPSRSLAWAGRRARRRRLLLARRRRRRGCCSRTSTRSCRRVTCGA